MRRLVLAACLLLSGCDLGRPSPEHLTGHERFLGFTVGMTRSQALAMACGAAAAHLSAGGVVSAPEPTPSIACGAVPALRERQAWRFALSEDVAPHGCPAPSASFLMLDFHGDRLEAVETLCEFPGADGSHGEPVRALK